MNKLSLILNSGKKVLLSQINSIKGNIDDDVSFDALYDRKNNSFDIFRFFFASMVIYSHAYPLLYGIQGKPDILVRLSKNQLTFGAFAVYGFFIISGFLVMQSLVNSKTYQEYLAKRALRIFPALIVSSVVTAYVLGPFITDMTVNDYFTGPNGLTPFEYVWKNSTFNLFGYAYPIRDLFSNNPYPSAVNGSLWTLKHEFASYLLLVVLSFFGFIRYRKLLLGLAAILGMLIYANFQTGFYLFELPNSWWVLGKPEYSQFIILSFYFLSGAIIYLFRDKIVFSYRLIVLAVVMLLVAVLVGHLKYVMLFVFPYLVIGLGIKWKIRSFTRFGDFSYGIYIYAFPIQQTLVFFFKEALSATKLTILAFAVTLIVAIMSWYFIEKPALSLKKKINFSRNYDIPQTKHVEAEVS